MTINDVGIDFWIFIVVFVTIGLMAGTFFGIRLEKRGFNNGKCINCGGDLKLFDYDSHGGRGYKCINRCDYHIWVSYKLVDGRGGIRLHD